MKHSPSVRAKASTRPRVFAAVLASASILGFTLGAGAAPAQAATPTSPWASRAAASYDALQDNLYLGTSGHGLYKENTDSTTGNPYSFLWEYREATQAALDMQGLPQIGPAYQDASARRVAGLQNYFAVTPDSKPGYESYLPAPLGTGGDVYFDDNDVVGLSLFREYQVTKNPDYLDKAEAAFSIVTRGWSTDKTLVCAGGENWFDSPSNTIRAANVTGLAAQLSAHLYEATHEGTYLDWSEKLYNWNNKCLKQSNGLYKNSISTDGTIDPTLWTYNSGAMIATATLLYRATDDPKYLTQAQRAADASLKYWSSGSRLQQQPAIFNAFYFKDLLLLDSVSHNPSYRTTIENYATSTWQSNRDTSTGLFHFQPSGGGNFDAARPAATLDQAAMIQIFSALAWKAPQLKYIS